jgi:hypothetical protein
MSSQEALLNPLFSLGGVAALAILLSAFPAMAQSNSGDYLFLIGSGFLCDSGDSSACPAVVKCADESAYELSGTGTFNPQSKSVTAAGTFTHKSPNGNSLETGIWMANELVSFDSYGIAPGARRQAGSAFGPLQFGPRRMPMLSGPMPAGGLAVFRIRLLPMWGPSRNAVLQVNCALGKVPEERQTEGIRLTFDGVTMDLWPTQFDENPHPRRPRGSGGPRQVDSRFRGNDQRGSDFQGGGSEFDQEISGRTMFVLTTPGVSPPSKPQASEDATGPTAAEAQQ